MENYGNDLFLSQEGCPSLDFTLLDRPSSSVVAARGATAPLFPGENSFSAFDIFDRAGVDSFDNRSIPGHRSYVSEIQKDAVRRNVATHPGLVQRQMHGVHDFFGQDDQQQNLGSGSWPGMGSGGSHIQPQYILSGVGITGESAAGNMPLKEKLGSDMQSSPSEMAAGDGGFSSLQASKLVDDNRIPDEAVATSSATPVRNQLGSALQYPSDSQNLSSKFGNNLPLNNGMIEHHLAASQNSPNQYGRYASQNPVGASVNEAPRPDALANHLPWKGSTQITQDLQARGPTRGGGMTELQLLRQQALQSKHEQALQSKQQHALRLQQQEELRLQKLEAMRVQQQEALRVQQQEAVRLQQQDATWVQQQDTLRMQQQEGMQQELTWAQQQEKSRLQQEAVRLKQQGAMRMQQQGAMRLQQHEAVRLSQQESMLAQHYEATRSRQLDAIQSQQQDGMQDETRSQKQDATLWQQHDVMRPQQQALWSQKQQWSHQRRVLESEQKQSMQSQQQKTWLSQQHEAWQLHPQQQVLPSQRQQALRLALQSQKHQGWQTQQQALSSQQQQPLHQPQQHQQQALWMQRQQNLWVQQQQALQSRQKEVFQSQQQQVPPSQQHLPLKTHHQLQQFFVKQQLNQQPEHARPQLTSQEAGTEFTGTSYSALLHGPDTPPSQPQIGEEPESEFEDHSGAFPSASTQSFIGPDGSSYYQGSSNDASTVHTSAKRYNLHPGSSPAEAASHLPADASFFLAKNAEEQNNLLEDRRGGLLLPSLEEPMFQADKTLAYSNVLKNSHRVDARPLVQSSQYGGEQFVQGLDSGRNQTNLLSQSQQHFQELQFSQQKSWESFAHKHAASKQNFSEANPSLSQGFLTSERSILQSGFQKNSSSFGPRGDDSYQFGSTQADSASDRYLHQISDSKRDIWGNEAAQQSNLMFQNSFSSVPPSDNSSTVLNKNQSTHLEVGVPSLKVAGCSSLPNQERFKSNQEACWKENDRASTSEEMPFSHSELDRSSHGFWKRHASLQESVSGLDTMCEPLRKVGTGSMWNHSLQQEKLVLEGQGDVHAAASVPNSAGGHITAGRGTQFLGQEGVFQQIPKHVGSQNFTDSFRETDAMIFEDKDNTHGSKMSVETQGSLADEQRTFQQQMDPSATNVSLAHLRHSRPSSPLSPQHVRLGLGPSSLPQNTQQVGTAGMGMSPRKDGLSRKGPASNLEIKKFHSASPYGGPSGAHLLNCSLLQTNGRPSSALSNSSSFSKESAESETFAPSSNASAHLERSKMSQHENVKFGGNSLCGAEHFQTSASSFEEEPLASLHGKVQSVFESSKQPFFSSGNSEGKLSTMYRQAGTDDTTLRVLQNQQIINMALKQLGSRAQAANIAGLLTTLKTSLSENSKNPGGREMFSPGNVDLDMPPAISKSDGGNEGGHVIQTVQRPQMVPREPITGHEDCSPSKLRSASQSVPVEHNSHAMVNQETFRNSEASGIASTSLHEDLQRQRSQSLSLINGNQAHLLHSGGHYENESEFMGSKTLSFAPSQPDAQMRNSEASFASSGQSQYLQQQRSVIESSSLHSTFKEPTPGSVWDSTLPRSAVKVVGRPNEAVLKSFDGPPVHGYLPKVTLGKQNDDAQITNNKYRSSMDLKEMLQQNASNSTSLDQSGLHLVNASLAAHGQMPMQVAKNFVNAMSLTHSDKHADIGVEGDIEALHKSRLNAGNSNDLVFSSQELRHDETSAQGRPTTFSQSSLINKLVQPVAFGDQDAHVPIGREDTFFKVEEGRPGLNVDVAASNQSSQHQVSPSKTSLHGVLAVHPKKRKKPVPLLIPWHVAAVQPRNSLPSTSEAEPVWANAANRVPEKDGGDVLKDNLTSGVRAKRRLKLTSQLMQQLISPLSSRLMHGNSLVDNECATYSLAKLGLEDACRLVANTQREATNSAHNSSEDKNMQQGRTWGMAKNVAVMRCVESFMERAKRLDSELARVDSSLSVSELGGKILDSEKMAIVNRLARHHGTGFTVDSSEICVVGSLPDAGTAPWRPSPKRYVTAAPMPRTLPGVKCLSL